MVQNRKGVINYLNSLLEHVTFEKKHPVYVCVHPELPPTLKKMLPHCCPEPAASSSFHSNTPESRSSTLSACADMLLSDFLRLVIRTYSWPSCGLLKEMILDSQSLSGEKTKVLKGRLCQSVSRSITEPLYELTTPGHVSKRRRICFDQTYLFGKKSPTPLQGY